VDADRNLPFHLGLRLGGVLWADSNAALIRAADGLTRIDNGRPTTIQLAPDLWGLFVEIAFVNRSVGWANRVGELYLTRDSGRSWSKVPRPPGGEILELIPISADEVWLSVNGDVDLWHSLDRGASWRPLWFQEKLGGFVRVAGEEWFAQATTWNGFIYHSTDAGRSWTRQAVPAKRPAAYAFLANGEGWLLDWPKDGVQVLLHTEDRGRRWGKVGPGFHDYREIRALEDGQAWLLNPKGRILVVQNHGASWHESVVVRESFWAFLN
jgi:photosystem II stability/assembly factor-like uncharacterized protein